MQLWITQPRTHGGWWAMLGMPMCVRRCARIAHPAWRARPSPVRAVAASSWQQLQLGPLPISRQPPAPPSPGGAGMCHEAAAEGLGRGCHVHHRSHFGSRYKLGCCGHAGLPIHHIACPTKARGKSGSLHHLPLCFSIPGHSWALPHHGSSTKCSNWKPEDMASAHDHHRSHFGSRYKLG